MLLRVFIVFLGLFSQSVLADSHWSLTGEQQVIPEQNAMGSIHGESFKYDQATIQNGILTLRQGQGFLADLAVMIFLFRQDIANQHFNINLDSQGSLPHIHMRWLAKNKSLPKSMVFTNEYVLQLEFGAIVGNKIRGKIYLALPDYLKSYVIGQFEADVK